MASGSRYPCALCGESLEDEASFRRHLEDAHEFFDPNTAPPPVPVLEQARHEPSAIGRGLSTQAALAAGLAVAFFLPWFNAPGFLSSSGVGMLSWLPSRVHGVESVVPYLAVLIPLGASAVIVQWWRGAPTDT